MAHRLGNHRLRPALSNAGKAKADVKRLEAKLRDARRVGATSTIAKIEQELAWLIANSLAS